jgi:hypothetical protein
MTFGLVNVAASPLGKVNVTLTVTTWLGLRPLNWNAHWAGGFWASGGVVAVTVPTPPPPERVADADRLEADGASVPYASHAPLLLDHVEVGGGSEIFPDPAVTSARRSGGPDFCFVLP